MRETPVSIADIHNKYNVDDLCSALVTTEDKFELEVPCDSIGTANSHLDIADDYLSALFVGEMIADFCTEIFAVEMSRDKMPCRSVRFSLRPRDPVKLAEMIVWLSAGFDRELWLDDVDFEGVWLSVQEFASELEERTLRFPELADNYLANYIAGEYDLPEEAVEAEHAVYPERQYGFWRSFASQTFGYDLYVSTKSWIVPLEADVEDLLRHYGGFIDGLPVFEQMKYLAIAHLPPLLLNRGSVVLYPEVESNNARACAEAISLKLQKGDSYNLSSPFSYPTSIRLSEDEGLLILQDTVAQYVFFDWYPQTPSVGLEQYLEEAIQTIEDLEALLGYSTEAALPWNELDDEQFEKLCYDIIGACGRYDPDKMRKFGKARSRDGGRDIETESRSRGGRPGVKWIIQCKLVKTANSLGARNLHISDVIDQYSAGGFCVMTNAVIDSTLYDKMDAIKANRNVEMEQWDRYRMERFLAKHPGIRKQYFDR